jgi:hypothetical protein
MEYAGQRASAFHAWNRLNIVNPASLAHLKTTTFEGGLRGAYTQLQDGDLSSNIWSANLAYLAIGMPVQNPINLLFNKKETKIQWGTGFYLKPYSVTGFEIEISDVLNGTDTFTRKYTGEGSTYIVNWGNGFKYKDLSFGLNIGYLFGNTDFERRLDFGDDNPGGILNYNTVNQNINNHKAFVWNLGVMYDFVFKYEQQADGKRGQPMKYLTVGATFNSDWNLNTKVDSLLYRENRGGSLQTDTLFSLQGQELKNNLPSVLQFGINYYHGEQWDAGINLAFSKWSSYKNLSNPETRNVKDAFSLSGGFSYTPDRNSFSRFWNRVTYSAGVYYKKDPRVLENNQIEDYGLKFGLSMPFISQRQVSYLNLGLGIGRMGVSDGYRESYVSFSLGYSLTDNEWFIKRKYD